MTDYGVTPEGFVKKPLAVILEELEDAVKTGPHAIDATLDTSPEQPLGQLLGIMAEREAAQWELLETAYNSNDRDKAEFFLLDAIGAVTGCKRRPATYSTVTLTCTLTSGTTLTEGVHKANVTGKPTDVWVVAETFTAGSTGTHAVKFRADTKGPRAANSGTITVINTPVSGWTVVTNAASATQGRDVELDAAYRARQVEELAQSGSGTVAAIRAALLELDDIIEVKVFENTKPWTDDDGLPPHSMEVLVWDGASPAADDDDIAQAVFDNKAGGIEFIGTESGEAVDPEDEDVTYVIPFNRATQKNVYIDITVTQDPDGPSIDAADVKAKIVAKQSTLKIGTDVIALALRAAALTSTGVLDAPVFELGFSASPSGTSNLAIGEREIALLDVANITVTVA